MKNLINESFRGFRMAVFNKLPTIAEKHKYADEHLPFLGKGAAREVFGLGAGKVLKLATEEIDDYGVEQNETEVEFYLNHQDIREYLTKIYSFDEENFLWIVSEAVKIIEDNTKLLAKFSITNDFLDYFYDMAYTSSSVEETIQKLKELETKDKFLKKIFKNIEYNNFDKELLNAMFIVIKKGAEDVNGLSQWGMTVDGRIVLSDYGL